MQVELSTHEFSFLCNCISETLESVDDRELQTRTGADSATLRMLRDKLARAVSADGHDSPDLR
ncbi:hypothetical protein [Curtobacterium luteum]|uniref:hypothetical protein n=1 Tax=Curtobacterium luteum TaxID=33881 RepID=UPI00380CA606